jgi:hypothetical protein
MPERERYAHLFGRNPFEGKNPEKVFSLLHWGNAHRHVISIDAPEPLVMLGMMALIKMPDRHLHFKSGEAFLAIGTKTNTMYIVPRVRNEPIEVVPKFSRNTATKIGPVTETHYLSSKGAKTQHYYYHEHEAPYPTLWTRKNGVGYIRPARHAGKPSYAVGVEGIVG